MKTIHAIYENGVFRPTEPVELPEGSFVRVEPEPIEAVPPAVAARRRVFEILSKSYETGDPLAAERHNQHQP